MAQQFNNQVVMITGANGNLGQGVVKRFVDEGAYLILIDRKGDTLPQLLADMGVPENRYQIEKADLTDENNVDALIQRLETQDLKINVLVHTVGGYDAGQPVHEAGIAVWDKMMTLNARAVYITCGRVARHMVEQEIAGKIVAVLARTALKGMKNAGAYSASKAAAQRVLESMAQELKEYNIQVNAILPGTIDTPPNREAMPNADFNKWVPVEDLADVIAFLASPNSRSVSGESIAVYGKS